MSRRGSARCGSSPAASPFRLSFDALARPLSPGAYYLTQMAAPLVLLGVGMGSALTPLTTAGMAGVADADAGAASGLIEFHPAASAAPFGVGALVTVFAAASSGAGSQALVEGVPTVLAGAAMPAARWP